MRFATIFVLLERKSTTVNIFSNNDYIKSQKRRDKWQKSGMKKFSNEYVGYLRMLSTMNAIKILHSRHTFFRTSNNPNTIFDFLPFGSTVHTPSEKWKKETNWNNIEVDSSKNTFIHSFIGGRLTLARGQNYLCYEFCGVTPWDPENREERKEKIVVRLFPVTFLHICKILRQPPPCLFAFFFAWYVWWSCVRANERDRRSDWQMDSIFSSVVIYVYLLTAGMPKRAPIHLYIWFSVSASAASRIFLRNGAGASEYDK